MSFDVENGKIYDLLFIKKQISPLSHKQIHSQKTFKTSPMSLTSSIEFQSRLRKLSKQKTTLLAESHSLQTNENNSFPTNPKIEDKLGKKNEEKCGKWGCTSK